MVGKCAFYAGIGSRLLASTLIIYVAPRTKESTGKCIFLSAVRPVAGCQVIGVRGVY